MKGKASVVVLVLVVFVAGFVAGIAVRSRGPLHLPSSIGSSRITTIQPQVQESQPTTVTPTSRYVGKWQQPGGRMLIINADGSAITPETGYFVEQHFRWHTQPGRIVFDGWVERKGYGFGYSYATMASDASYITCHDQAGTPAVI